MSRFNMKNAMAAVGLIIAAAGSASGQTLTVDEPAFGAREYVGSQTRVVMTLDSSAGGGNITAVDVQVFNLLSDGSTVTFGAAESVNADAVSDAVDGSGFNTGAFPMGIADPEDISIDMEIAINNNAMIGTNIAGAQAIVGDAFGPNTVTAVGIRFVVTTTTDGAVQTVNPTTSTAGDSSNDGDDAGASFVFDNAAESPQWLPAPTLLSVSISDPSTTPTVNYFFNRDLDNGAGANDLNNLTTGDVDANDISQAGMAPTTAVTGTAFNPANNVLRVTFADDANKPTAGQIFGFIANDTDADGADDARDFVGYSLVGLTGTAANAVELAATGASWTAGSAVGGNTAVLQVQFNQILNNAGSADAYDCSLNGMFLVADIGASFGVPAIDTDDPTRVNIAVDLNTVGTDDIGVASNGRALDGNTGVDFDGVGVIDHSQLEFFVQVRDDGGTDPQDALGNNLDLSGTPFDDTNAVADGVEPSLLGGATLDTTGDGLIDAVALFFDETMANAGITGVTVTALDATNTTDISMRDAVTGALPAAAAVALMGNQTIPATFTASLDTVAVTPGTDNPAFQTNNAVVLGGLDLSVFGTMMQVAPSSGDTGNFQIDYDGMTGGLTDAAGNAFSPMATVMQAANDDRAAPALLDVFYYTGDNQGANNDQLAVEQDGVVGDGSDNDRALAVFSEDLADNVADETGFTSNGTTFDTSNNNGGRLAGGTMDNLFTLVNDEDVDFAPGDTFALNGGVDISDAAGNEAAGTGVAGDCVAPYIPLQNDGGVIDSAFLVDDDNDGFADRVFLQFTVDVVQADIASDGSDFQSFGANSGTITGADTLTGSDNSIVVLTLTDGEVSMNADADFRYLGSTAANLLEALANGKEVSDTDTTFVAQEINDPTIFTNAPDVMVIAGQLLGPDGVSPAPIGTRIYATLAVPTIDSIEADHNGVVFSYSYADREGYGQDDSLDAFNNVFFGFRDFLYLSRELDNEQYFMNVKYLNDDDNGSGILTDVIDITLNTRNLSSITFSGTGESNADRVRGTASLCWRLIRGSSTVGNLYDNGFSANSNSLLLSETVISEAGGRYAMHVSGLGGAFTGSPIADLDLPVIMWCQLPTGERYALTSIYTSASTNDFDGDGVIGDGVVFAPNNLTQDNGAATDATNINFSLANVTTRTIHANDWTMMPFSSASGFANSSRDIPELPNGVAEGNIVTDSWLAASPMEQFVYWDDNSFDGVFDSSDGGFGELFVDFDCVDHMRFTLTTNGIEMGSGMSQVVGGYGVGILEISGNNWGVFQFGAPIAPQAVFAANPISGSAANATQGWLLVSTSDNHDDATNFFTANPGTDYIIFFDNQGNDGIQVRSLSVTPGDANANNLEELPSGSAPFVHYIN